MGRGGGRGGTGNENNGGAWARKAGHSKYRANPRPGVNLDGNGGNSGQALIGGI
ncbi:MAG: hypothetical protein GY847_35715 [Proteobacteria bacterium]|nr:hypothetical protein [Pseudomonadota bacterium]